LKFGHASSSIVLKASHGGKRWRLARFINARQ
jgi:hypothetical protein